MMANALVRVADQNASRGTSDSSGQRDSTPGDAREAKRADVDLRHRRPVPPPAAPVPSGRANGAVRGDASDSGSGMNDVADGSERGLHSAVVAAADATDAAERQARAARAAAVLDMQAVVEVLAVRCVSPSPPRRS